MGSSNHTFGESGFARTDDDRSLHYMVSGSGPVTVVFESGLGFSRSCWGLVQPAIARLTRAVVYDRAGFGDSEVDVAPRTIARMARDLGALLDHLGTGPFLLVGHSWGGPIIRRVAADMPGRVRGLVLVDPTDENCDLYFTSAVRRNFALTRSITPFLARTGLYRALGSRPGRVQPADVAADHSRDDFGIAGATAATAELAVFHPELEKLRDSAPEIGDIEVSLISGARASRLERAQRLAIRAAHRRSVETFANARMIDAVTSGHSVMFEQPQLVIDEIATMLRLDTTRLPAR